MSTDIKPGQIWKDRDDNARLRVDTIYPTRVGFTWMTTGAATSEYVDEFLSRFVLATPAPLDPSADDALAASVQRLGKVWAEYRDQQVRGAAKALDAVAASIQQVVDAAAKADQPAPEPEPEWKVGQLADITIGDGSWVRAIRVETQTDDEHVWQTVPASSWWSDENVTDVRPLVVIDPAEVDVEALQYAAEKAHGADVCDALAGAKAFLAGLGIEASS